MTLNLEELIDNYTPYQFLIKNTILDCSMFAEKELREIEEKSASLIIGLVYILAASLFILIYIPIIVALFFKEHFQGTINKTLIYISFLNIGSLLICGFFCGYMKINGFVPCSLPSTSTTIGFLTFFLFATLSISTLLLLFIKTIELANETLCDSLFGKKKLTLWILEKSFCVKTLSIMALSTLVHETYALHLNESSLSTTYLGYNNGLSLFCTIIFVASTTYATFTHFKGMVRYRLFGLENEHILSVVQILTFTFEMIIAIIFLIFSSLDHYFNFSPPHPLTSITILGYVLKIAFAENTALTLVLLVICGRKNYNVMDKYTRCWEKVNVGRVIGGLLIVGGCNIYSFEPWVYKKAVNIWSPNDYTFEPFDVQHMEYAIFFVFYSYWVLGVFLLFFGSLGYMVSMYCKSKSPKPNPISYEHSERINKENFENNLFIHSSTILLIQTLEVLGITIITECFDEVNYYFIFQHYFIICNLLCCVLQIVSNQNLNKPIFSPVTYLIADGHIQKSMFIPIHAGKGQILDIPEVEPLTQLKPSVQSYQITISSQNTSS
uniref:Serpentine receptor class gamma n=1 Tax=Rhabditophanes sp. KR3021 TaxID=114890 RepID=A0AC35TQ58_9BILA